jgi:hypothetical protein
MERATQLLKNDGQFALLTQGTYLDKEWAKGLRELLATKTQIKSIVDLNPFGQLFFNAMNSPCITASVNTGHAVDGYCIAIVSQSPRDFRELKKNERRQKVVATVRGVLDELSKTKNSENLFASGTHIKRARLRETAGDRWDLSGGADAIKFHSDWHTAAELLEMRQGVTPGGFLEIFLLDEKRVKLLELEDALVQDAIKSKQLERWRVEWNDLKLFYPYHMRGDKSEPAFTIPWEDIKDQKLKNRLIDISIEDALDFEHQIDGRETDIVSKAGINRESVKQLLRRRIALGLVKYPKSAAYLVSNYEKLQGRIFEKKKFTQLGKRLYEYHRPRDPHIMLTKPRILSPTLIREVRFALDKHGYLSDHACLMIQPTDATSTNWAGFSAAASKVVGQKLSKIQLLRYCLAFLNSQYSQKRLVTGHRPTPKGSYAITEAFLNEIPIPTSRAKKLTLSIIDLVRELEREEFKLTGSDEVEQLERKLAALVEEALAPVHA